MKLRKEITEMRERFAIDLFKADVRLCIPTANKMICEHFGSKIKVNRLYELRKTAREQIVTEDCSDVNKENGQ